MKIKYFAISFLAIIFPLFSMVANAELLNPNKQLLPSPFPVYSNGKIAINHPVPMPEFKRILMPTVNTYMAAPGCYLMCYSHQATQNSYKVANAIYAVGQIRVAGQYRGRICVPTNYNKQDVSESGEFKQLCNTQIDACKSKGDCWTGGDTGGWFGVQK